MESIIPFKLGIVSVSKTSPGASILFHESIRLNIPTDFLTINDLIETNIADIYSKIIFRIGPSTYWRYKELLEELPESHKESLRKIVAAFDKSSSYLLMKDKIPIPDFKITTINDIEFAGNIFIIKPPIGNQGRGIYLVDSEAKLQEIKKAKDDLDELVIVQEYVPESMGADKRLFVVGDKVVASMQRYSTSHDFRANLHLGGRAETYIPTKTEENIAIECNKLHGLVYSGVDIVDSSRGPLVLEINPSPGFKIEDIAKVNISNLIIREYLRG